jgi:hypothetical protein
MKKEKETKRKYIKDKQVLVFNVKYGLILLYMQSKKKKQKKKQKKINKNNKTCHGYSY